MPIAKNVPHGILGSEFVDRHLSNTPTQTPQLKHPNSNTPTQTHKYEHPNSSTPTAPAKGGTFAARLQPFCSHFVAPKHDRYTIDIR